MELSLRLSFYLRPGLRGYTVGTTEGFLIEIMESLALNLIVESCRSAHNTI
jgi:hypothetical protein